jgi:hypothetical protein
VLDLLLIFLKGSRSEPFKKINNRFETLPNFNRSAGKPNRASDTPTNWSRFGAGREKKFGYFSI